MRKFAAAKLLQTLSEESPETLYAYFDSLVALWVNDNSIIRWNGILALGNLGGVDAGKKLDRILEQYLALINGPQMIDAANTIRGGTAIAFAKPYLADRIGGPFAWWSALTTKSRSAATWRWDMLSWRGKRYLRCCMISAPRNCLFAGSSVIRGTRRGQRRSSLGRSASLAKEVRPDRVGGWYGEVAA